MNLSVNHRITESYENYRNVRCIVYKTRNIRILLTNQGFITENGKR